MLVYAQLIGLVIISFPEGYFGFVMTKLAVAVSRHLVPRAEDVKLSSFEFRGRTPGPWREMAHVGMGQN